MFMDFKGFKKVSDDGKMSIMENEKGHKIHIHKAALSKDLKKQLDSLPLHQAEPKDEIPDIEDSMKKDEQPDDTTPEEVSQHPPVNININAGGGQPPIPQNILGATSGGNAINPPMAVGSQDQSQSNPVQAQPGQPQVQPMPGPLPTGSQEDVEKQFEGIPGYEQQKAGTIGQATAISDEKTKEAALLGKGAGQEQANLEKTQQTLLDQANEIKSVIDDARNNEINPNHYLENMGVGKKISTAVGLLLGGLGSGLSGGPNVAMQFLNSQIERDLEAQKLNMSNRHNVLSALYQQYGNTMATDNMFRAIRAGIIGDQIKQAMAGSQSQQALAAGTQALGQLQQQYIPQWYRSSLMEQLRGPQQVSTGAMNPQQGIALANRNLNALHQAGMVSDNVFNKATDESSKAEEIEKVRQAFQDSYNHINSLALRGSLSPFDRQSAIDSVAARAEHLGIGRFQENAAKNLADALLPRRIEGGDTTKVKMDRLNSFFDGLHNTPTLQGLEQVYGVPLTIPSVRGGRLVKGAEGGTFKQVPK